MSNSNAGNFDDDDDEFGDSSFLMDVDLDAIEAAAANANANANANAKPSPLTTASATSITGNKQKLPEQESNPISSPTAAASKRRKVLSSVKVEENSNVNSNNSNTDINSKAGGNNNNNNNNNNTAELTKTLSNYFGYPVFREGQLDVVQAVVERQQDVAVFMATGSGKSLCYQIPALHTKTITIVVSPLISLMQDQVHKLNGLAVFSGSSSSPSPGENRNGNNNHSSNKDLATFLGSGQADARQEDFAMDGAYLLVYVTPEKLLSGNFLDRLCTLHKTKRKIGLIAIDEAHCVSEWGHDFRDSFRSIGQVLRTEAAPEIRQIPIMALTATALPRVQKDICQSLHLRSPKVAHSSFDRTNLVISVLRKDRTMSLAAAMEPLAKTLMKTSQPRQQSTIVYVSTRNQVDETVAFLKQRLQQHSNTVKVEGYHAGMSNADRSDAHTNFLTGKTTVIAATVAFGMGIDKPDTRRVIHYGPPKTVEEYTQQIGRAGRDGIQAECTMYVSETDFDKYKSDFYLGKLSGQTKDSVVASIDALKSFALDSVKCRRKALLDFFQETPAFGERCGTCDNCQKVATLDANDLERDFGNLGARVVLQAIDSLDEQGVSTIASVIGGKSVDSYRYRRGLVESAVKEKMLQRKQDVGKKMSQEAFRELIVPLTQRGFLKETSKKAVVQGFSRSWTIYNLTPQGKSALFDNSIPITLPVPESVLELERKEKARRQRVLDDLEASGVSLDNLPQEEIETGDGEVIRAMSKWNSHVQNKRKNGKEERATELVELQSSLEKWRAETAILAKMAPSTVLAEHLLYALCYIAATLPSGMKMEESTLITIGVRSREMVSLCHIINQWIEKFNPASKEGESSTDSAQMQLVPGKVVETTSSWEFFVYKVVKKTGLASWESSYTRFREGESPQTIATAPASGKPIQVRTVCGHIIQGVLHGKPVDLHRLSQFLPPPSSSEWEILQAAEVSTGIDVCGNPLNCGVGGAQFTKTEFLRPVMGDTYIDTPYKERDEEEKTKFGNWCDKLDWYTTLRRIGYQPTFGPP